MSPGSQHEMKDIQADGLNSGGESNESKGMSVDFPVLDGES